MVPYTHPVYRNGKRLLWHGAWRGAGRHEKVQRLPSKAAIAPQPPPQAQAASVQSSPQSQAMKPFSILADPDDLSAARMSRDFTAVLNDKGAPVRALVGSTSPMGLTKVVRTDMADFAIVTLDSAIVSAKADPGWPKKTPVVATLAPETVEVIAPKEIKTVSDLQGKSVSFGDPDSATANSARLLFSRLGVSVHATYEPLTEALEALAASRRSAVVVLGAEDSRALADFGEDGHFHILAIPWSPALESVYAPARVTSAERPNLVSASDAVETVAEPMALVALDSVAGSPRAEATGRLSRIFFDSYDALLTGERDPHWRDVNLAAEASLPNAAWPRLGAAQAWVDDKKGASDASLDAFRQSAKAVAETSGGPKAEDSDRLYDSLTRWRGLMQ